VGVYLLHMTGPGSLFIVLGALSGFVSVAAGAFGAHALRKRLSADLLAVFETGARYQMFHALGLVGIGLLLGRQASATLDTAGWLFLVGSVLFSGSLYALALSGVRRFGAIAPLGGLAFLGGWLALAWAALRG
jgi:uncharacterized membrane protein YgdD (TMEM256/DUF423 family)